MGGTFLDYVTTLNIKYRKLAETYIRKSEVAYQSYPITIGNEIFIEVLYYKKRLFFTTFSKPIGALVITESGTVLEREKAVEVSTKYHMFDALMSYEALEKIKKLISPFDNLQEIINILKKILRRLAGSNIESSFAKTIKALEFDRDTMDETNKGLEFLVKQANIAQKSKIFSDLKKLEKVFFDALNLQTERTYKYFDIAADRKKVLAFLENQTNIQFLTEEEKKFVYIVKQALKGFASKDEQNTKLFAQQGENFDHRKFQLKKFGDEVQKVLRNK